MTDFDWKLTIQQWVEKRQKIKPFQSDLFQFFEKAFQNTAFPQKALFGTTDSSISLLTGGIYFAAFSQGSIWILLDKLFEIPNANCNIASSTKDFSEPLYWLGTKDLNNLKLIIENQEIWDSFQNATIKIYDNKRITTFRPKIAKNKVTLADFYFHGFPTQTIFESEHELQEKVRQAKKLSSKERREKLSIANPKPEKSITTQTIFKRNQYVIVEVLERANGICERCKKPAPFFRDIDDSPYLEVHHILPLAEGGDDTVENAIALCPNCHRHAHHGKKTY